MDDAIIRQLETDLSALRARLEEMDIFKDIQALERVIRHRRDKLHRTSAVVSNERPVSAGRQEAATSVAMKDAAERFLRDKIGPIQTKDILDSLASQGIQVPGDNPQNNLSAHMSRDSRFLSRGREGWVLSSSVQPEIEAMLSVALQYVDSLADSDADVLVKAFNLSDDIPTDVDRDILHNARANLGRKLVEEEKIALRDAVRKAIAKRNIPFDDATINA